MRSARGTIFLGLFVQKNRGQILSYTNRTNDATKEFIRRFFIPSFIAFNVLLILQGEGEGLHAFSSMTSEFF